MRVVLSGVISKPKLSMIDTSGITRTSSYSNITKHFFTTGLKVTKKQQVYNRHGLIVLITRNMIENKLVSKIMWKLFVEVDIRCQLKCCMCTRFKVISV